MIKDINKLAMLYVCADCHARFTQACHPQRNAKKCTLRKTKSNKEVKAPLTAYEKSFYNEVQSSAHSIRWLQCTRRVLGKHIHHALCGHGGERWISGAPVDGHVPSTKTVYQCQGCFWHGCKKCYPNRRDQFVSHKQTLEEKYGSLSQNRKQ